MNRPVSHSCALIYSDSYEKYDFGPWHPMKPVRLALTYELIRDYGLLDDVRLVEPGPATDDELALVHDPAYIEKVKELSAPGAEELAAPGWGLGTGDNPVFAGMHAAAATAVGGALQAGRMIMDGSLDHAFHMGGGLHHALEAKASGFCIYNDPAIAIADLKARYGARVLYLDIDAHHGDGVQYVFEGDSQVLTISIHESGAYLFPGTGFAGDIGKGGGKGYAVNVPLSPFSSDDVYLEVFNELVVPLARAFQPGIFLTQNGCDAHWSDPLSHLSLTMDGFQELFRLQHRLVHELAGGRWLALGGGGYQSYTTVPRAWTILMAVMAGRRLDDRIPEEWRRECARFEQGPAPTFLVKEKEPPVPAQEREKARAAARESIERIKKTVFPIVGAS